QDSLMQTKIGQMTRPISLSALTTQRDCLLSQRHRKGELDNFLFNSFLALAVETSKNQIPFHNCTLPSSTLYGIYKAALRRILIEKTSGIERGEYAECRFISEVNNLEVYKNTCAKKMLNRLLFLGCLLRALRSENPGCVLYQCDIEKTRHGVTAHKVTNQREKRIIIATRKQNRTVYYRLRTHVREGRAQVKAHSLKGGSEGTKSSRGLDPEIKLYK
ncbi:hypothetical protein N325_02974, partial [Colius striatus]